MALVLQHRGRVALRSSCAEPLMQLHLYPLFYAIAITMVRPLLPESERRSEVLQLRLTKGERRGMEEGAAAAGEQLSEFIRSAALDKAERAIKKAKRKA